MFIFPFSPKMAMLARPTSPERKCTSENDGVTMTIATQCIRTYVRSYVSFESFFCCSLLDRRKRLFLCTWDVFETWDGRVPKITQNIYEVLTYNLSLIPLEYLYSAKGTEYFSETSKDRIEGYSFPSTRTRTFILSTRVPVHRKTKCDCASYLETWIAASW